MAMLIVVGLTACDKEKASVMERVVAQQQTEEAERVANPDKFLQHLVSTNAAVLGTKESENTPSLQISFSNGYMETGAPGKMPLWYGQSFSAGSPHSTCIGFDHQFFALVHEYVCVTIRDFQALGNDFKRGDLYIEQTFEDSSLGRGATQYYRAHVK